MLFSSGPATHPHVCYTCQLRKNDIPHRFMEVVDMQLLLGCLENSQLKFLMVHPKMVQVSVINYVAARGPFYYHGLSLIPACISNYNHYKVWDEIAFPLSPKFESENPSPKIRFRKSESENPNLKIRVRKSESENPSPKIRVRKSIPWSLGMDKLFHHTLNFTGYVITYPCW